MSTIVVVVLLVVLAIWMSREWTKLGRLVQDEHAQLMGLIEDGKRERAQLMQVIGEKQSYKDSLDKIADVIDTYIKAVELWVDQVDLVVQERNEYSKELLNEACFADKASVIENLETLEKVLREIRGG